MSDATWNRIEALFHAMADLDPSERAAYLAEHEQDPKIIQRVEELLHAHARSDGAVEAMLRQSTDLEQDSDSRIDETLGPYRILEMIGRGGMATVYRAERVDGAYDKVVAVKVLRGTTLDPITTERFQRERQVLAGLDHPGIAPILDGGTTRDGAPYLVLDYIDGESITSWCQSHGLPLKERLALFLEVSDAVAYAHRNLVLHRDLKPANILVDSEARPWLLDFGIAKLLAQDSADLTVEGTSPLTLDYASPEQILGQPLSTATDVYALGVILYELLSATHPYPRSAGTDPTTWQRERTTREPKAPSSAVRIAPRKSPHASLKNGVKGDLDNIALMALRIDPTQRYGSVEALAADIRRHLNGLPVLARPHTLSYRTTRFVKRNRLGVMLSSALVLAVVVGAIVSLRFGISAEQARQEAVSRQEVANQLNELWNEAIASADPAHNQRQDITVREVLAEAERELLSRPVSDPRISAGLLTTLAVSYRNLTLFGRADSVLTRALADAEAGMPNTRVEFVAALAERSRLLLEFDRADEAVEAAREAVERAQALDSRDPLPLARALRALSDAYRRSGHLRDSESALMSAIETVEPIDSDDARLELAQCANSLGIVLRESGRLGESEEWFMRSLAYHEEFFGDHSRTAQILSNLSVTLEAADRTLESIPHLERALAIHQRVYPGGDPQIATTQLTLAGALSVLGRYEDAVAMFAEAETTFRKVYGPDHGYVAVTVNNRAYVHVDAGHPEAAVPVFEEAAELFEKAYGKEHPWTAACRHNVVYFRLRVGLLDGIEERARENLELRRAILEKGHLDIGRSLQLFGQVQFKMHQADAALESFESAQQVFEARVPYTHGLRRSILTDIGRCLLELGRRDEAEPLLARALAVSDSLNGPDDPTAVAARQLLEQLPAN